MNAGRRTFTVLCAIAALVAIATHAEAQYQIWANWYDSAANYDDFSTGLAVDRSGGAIIGIRSTVVGGGLDYVAVRYDANGQQVWSTVFDSSGGDFMTDLAQDDEGYVILGGNADGSSSPDIVIVRLDPLGHILWSARYDNGQTESSAMVATGLAGKIYVAGASDGASTLADYVTIMYSTNGTQLWVRRYAGPIAGRTVDSPTDIQIDREGSAIVTGYSETVNQESGRDYATVKYDSLGSLQWVTRYNGPAGQSDVATAIAVGTEDDVYVTGTSAVVAGRSEWSTIKYSTTGTEVWTSRYRGPSPGLGTGIASDIEIDRTENVYVAGDWTLNNNTDVVVVKYDAQGSQAWVATYSGPGNGSDSASTLVLDAADSVYVAGYTTGSGTGTDFLAIKYNSSGAEQWRISYDSPGVAGYDAARYIASTSSGEVLLAGDAARDVSGRLDVATIKYSQDPFPDCNENGRPDLEDVQQGISADCNFNYIPDECEKVTCSGACCLGDGTCMVLREALCQLFAGSQWVGPDTTCVNVGGDIRCPLGACCLTDGSCSDDRTPSECEADGGTFRGSMTTCQGANCPQPSGACCLVSGGCLSLSRADCNVFPGATWVGALSTCVDVGGTPRCPLGACCLADGTCREGQLPAECQALGGTHRPGGVTCAQAACPQPNGACCLSSGSCLSATQVECGLFGGATWAGALTACADVQGTPTCPLGACCLPDGRCVGDILSAACTAQAGTFRGPGSGCANANCPQPTGACCLANGSCIVLLRADCQAAPNNRWAGPNTTCVDGNANGRADACESVPGDINGDGAANPGDIPPFVSVMLGTPQAPEHVGRADLNGDGAANGADVAAMVGVLAGS